MINTIRNIMNDTTGNSEKNTTRNTSKRTMIRARKNSIKNTISILLLTTVLALLLMGCSKDAAVDQSAKLDQFAKPEKGETVAEIMIQGHGSIKVKFFEEAAPKAVENFVTHAKNGYYDGLTFHRIIEDFMIQGGDPTGTGMGGESIWGERFKDEFSEDLQPYRGALCMANGGKDTNGSQFFIVQSSETYGKDILEQVEKTYRTKFNETAVENYDTVGGTPWLYEKHTVFGQVYEGYEVLDAVAKVDKVDEAQGIPAESVIIEKIIITEN